MHRFVIIGGNPTASQLPTWTSLLSYQKMTFFPDYFSGQSHLHHWIKPMLNNVGRQCRGSRGVSCDRVRQQLRASHHNGKAFRKWWTGNSLCFHLSKSRHLAQDTSASWQHLCSHLAGKPLVVKLPLAGKFSIHGLNLATHHCALLMEPRNERNSASAHQGLL